MKHFERTRDASQRREAFDEKAFSLVELQVAVVLMLFVIGVAMSAHLFGLNMFQRARLKITATEEARVVLGKMREEIRAAANVIVGTGDHNTFREIGDNTNQVGNALQIFPTTNANNYVIYYVDDWENMQKWSTTEQRLVTLAGCITNRAVFHARDFSGNILTNNEHNRVIQITLQMLERYNRQGGISDYYQVQTKATRRLVQ
jgi:hypothetical protein